MRHRGKFEAENPSPYELSRSRIENFVRCPACFYLQQVEGLKFPSIPGFNINEATDILLKRDFDKCRQQQICHPFLKQQGFSNLVPFDHPDFELWTQSLHFGAAGRFHFVHEPTNLKIGGGVDDVWKNTDTGQLHIVDYKSTSQKTDGKNISLDDKWKAGYKRQADLYVWILGKKGFNVSTTSYFLYCDGDRFCSNGFLGDENANMLFKVSLLPYQTNTSWIEDVLFDVKKCLTQKKRPNHSDQCEYGNFINFFV